jgi:hypothetical protein
MWTDRKNRQHYQLGDRLRYHIYKRSLKAWANLMYANLVTEEKHIKALERRLR